MTAIDTTRWPEGDLCPVVALGAMDYAGAFAQQVAWHERVLAWHDAGHEHHRRVGVLLVVEHPPTITVSHRANAGSNWAGKNNTEKYALVKGYLAYAPAAVTDFQPNGYTFNFPATPDGRVGITRTDGNAQVDIYY